MPADLALAGALFIAAERRDDAALAGAMAGCAVLLVDAWCYSDATAGQLLPHLAGATSAVMLSSKAVYVDAAGNHVNSDVAPRFDAPILENNPTTAVGNRGTTNPGKAMCFNKVAAENTLLDSWPSRDGLIRASKGSG